MTQGPLSYYPFVQSDPAGYGFGGAPAAGAGPDFYFENVPQGMCAWQNDAPPSQLWQNGLCFVQFFAKPPSTPGITKILEVSALDFDFGVAPVQGMMAVWGWDPTATALPVKLWEGRTNASTAGTNYPVPWTVEIVADVTNYPFYVVTMDAPWQYTPDTPDISAQCVLQTAGLSPLTYNAPNPQPCLGYLGTHAWGTSFGSTFPLNPDPSNPLYQMMKWMRVGVKK